MDIKISIQNDEISGMLALRYARLKNLSPVMREIAGIMHDAVEENFRSQGRPKWEPSLRVKKGGGMTLQKSGRLAKSIAAHSTRDSAIVGTNVAYAAIHQFGGPITQGARRATLAFRASGGFMSHRDARRNKSGAIRVAFAKYGARTINMPARPYLALQDGDLQEIRYKLTRYILGLR